MTQPSPVTVPPSTTTFVDEGQALAPTWLQGYWGSRFMFSLDVMFDTLADASGYAVRAGLPSLAPPDALPYIAQDRQIVQGYGEADAAFVVRLQQWLDLWIHAGSSMGVMLAVLGYLSPLTPRIRTVQTAADGSYTSWDTYVAGATPFPQGAVVPNPPDHVAVTGSWFWDSLDTPFYAPWMRWRSWFIIYSIAGSPWAAPSATWGGGSTWGDGSCWGWTGTAAEAATLTQLAKQWKSAGTWIPWIVVVYNASWFGPALAFGSAHMPDGHWGYYGKVVSDATYGQVYVPARPAASVMSFIAGTADGGGPLGTG